VVLTAGGTAVLDEIRRRRRAGPAELLDRLTPAEQAELVRLLSRLAGDS
jgi:DNA-binding MarR family transcriptional regulator